MLAFFAIRLLRALTTTIKATKKRSIAAAKIGDTGFDPIAGTGFHPIASLEVKTASSTLTPPSQPSVLEAQA
jgi:hypothetical protein